MFFNKKNKKEEDKCISCGRNSNLKYNFCPHCGESKMNEAEEAEAFGLLGKSDNIDKLSPASMNDASTLEKIISTMMQTAMKTMINEMQSPNMPKPEIQNLPNGIRITLNQPKKTKKEGKDKEVKISHEQMEKLESLPRTSAKTTIRRFSDKVVYELSASGIESLDDIFISKLENGYEVKALGKNKVYVNSIPVNLPLIKYGITDKTILLEFNSNQQ